MSKNVCHKHSFPFYLFNTSFDKDTLWSSYEFHKNRMPKHIIIIIIANTTHHHHHHDDDDGKPKYLTNLIGLAKILKAN